MKKEIIYLIVVLFLSLIIATTSNASVIGKILNPIIQKNYSDEILYVGGSGPQNYSKIQDAIDNASIGDTIFVFSRDLSYYENIIIKKNNIQLIGEDKYSTIIDGNGVSDVVQIIADYVTINGFTLKHSGSIEDPEYDAGIHLIYPSDHNNISDNIIINNWNGVCLQSSKNNTISKNIISHNMKGLLIFADSAYNLICENHIENNNYGLFISSSISNIIIENIIANNSEYGSYLYFVRLQTIQRNNFINNTYQFIFIERLRLVFEKNYWSQNYWDNWVGFGPKLLKGQMFTEWVGQILVPWINFDWFPADKPYTN